MDEVRPTSARIVLVGGLLVVIVAIALLMAGQGVAVGAGALVGLILGGVGGLAMALWAARRDESSTSFAILRSASDGQLNEEFLRELHEVSELVGVDLGPVRAVRQVLVTAEASGLTVHLVSMEHREGGLALNLEVRSSPGVRVPMGMAVVSASDDIGTIYQAGSQGQGGSSNGTRFEGVVVPPPPSDATRLTVTIERFLDPFGRGSSMTGPWTFEVPLA
jgi:hypothetical protein